MFKETEEIERKTKATEGLKPMLKPVVKIFIVPFPPHEIFQNLKMNFKSGSEGFARSATQAELDARITANVQNLQNLHESFSIPDFKKKLAQNFSANIKGII